MAQKTNMTGRELLAKRTFDLELEVNQVSKELVKMYDTMGDIEAQNLDFESRLALDKQKQQLVNQHPAYANLVKAAAEKEQFVKSHLSLVSFVKLLLSSDDKYSNDFYNEIYKALEETEDGSND